MNIEDQLRIENQVKIQSGILKTLQIMQGVNKAAMKWDNIDLDPIPKFRIKVGQDRVGQL